jgi:hypothetical protein
MRMSGLTDYLRCMNLDGAGTAEELLTFVWVSSAFHPRLESYHSRTSREA